MLEWIPPSTDWGPIPPSEAERAAYIEAFFWKRVRKRNGGRRTNHRYCWTWAGSHTNQGYGVILIHHLDEYRKLAHRYAYELLVGPIPAGLGLDHLCRVRDCVNPAHLEPVTQAVNNQRGADARRREDAAERCLRGHRYSGVKGGYRYCYQCERIRNAARKRGV